MIPLSLCDECDHPWLDHDLYGCQHHECNCTLISRDIRFDRRARKAVPR